MIPSFFSSSRQVLKASASGMVYAFFTRDRSDTGGDRIPADAFDQP